jgi:uncharacterized membrane protein YfcA
VTPAWFALAFAAVGFGAFVQSATGFGFALLATPPLLLALGPHKTVVMILLLHTIQCALVVGDERDALEPRPLGPLVLGGLVGTPIGAVALARFDPAPLQVGIGVLVALSGVLLLVGPPRPLRAERAGSLVAGFASGMLNSGTGLSGPPVALYLSNQGWPRDRFRLALIATFLASNLAALALFVPLGLLTWSPVRAMLPLAPAVLVGWLLHRVTRDALAALHGRMFRIVVGVLIVVAGLVSAGPWAWAAFTG